MLLICIALTPAQFLASLAHTRAGIPEGVVTMGAIAHLSSHLHSEDEEVHLIKSTLIKTLFLLSALRRHFPLQAGTRSLRHCTRLPELQPLRTSPPTGGMQETSTDIQSTDGTCSQGCQNMPQVHIRVQKTEKIGPSVTQVSLDHQPFPHLSVSLKTKSCCVAKRYISVAKR